MADWRYAHLAYPPDLDDACSDAAAACVMNVLNAQSGAAARCAFKTPAGVVEAFADCSITSGVRALRSAVVVWRHDEHAEITKLLGDMG